MATRSTVGSAKLRALHDALKGQAEFVLQPCDGLVDAIEAHDGDRIAQLCEQYTRAMGPFGTAPGCIDTLVLGCTHYIFAKDALLPLVGAGVAIIETGEPVARQTRRMLESAGLLHTAGTGRRAVADDGLGRRIAGRGAALARRLSRLPVKPAAPPRGRASHSPARGTPARRRTARWWT